MKFAVCISKLLLTLTAMTSSFAFASVIDEIERDVCMNTARPVCTTRNSNGVFNQTISLQVVDCEAKLASEHIDCRDILPENSEKRRCHPSQFCDRDQGLETLENCGLGFIKPFWETVWSPIEMGAAVLTDAGKTIWQCTTQKNCGTPVLTAQQTAELEKMRQQFLDQLIQDEKSEEQKLCGEIGNGFGCPLPELTCRQWDEVLTGHTVVVGGKPYTASTVSNKDGFNKGHFCSAALGRLATRRDDLRNSSARIAAEGIQLWLKDYRASFACYQPRYAAENICQLAGAGAEFLLFSGAFLKALRLAKLGRSPAEIKVALAAEKPIGGRFPPRKIDASPGKVIATTSGINVTLTGDVAQSTREVMGAAASYIGTPETFQAEAIAAAGAKKKKKKIILSAVQRLRDLRKYYGRYLLFSPEDAGRILRQIATLEDAGVAREKILETMKIAYESPVCPI